MAPQPRQVLPECAPDSHTHSAEKDCTTAQVSTNPKTGPGGTVPTFRCSPEMKGGRVSGWRQMPRRTPSRGAVCQSRTPCHHHQQCAQSTFAKRLREKCAQISRKAGGMFGKETRGISPKCARKFREKRFQASRKGWDRISRTNIP